MSLARLRTSPLIRIPLNLAALLLAASLVSAPLSVAAEKENSDSFDALMERYSQEQAPAKVGNTEKSDKAEKVAVRKPKRAPEASSAEAPPIDAANPVVKMTGSEGAASREKLILNGQSGCYVVEFTSRPGEVISCKEMLPLSYTKRDCAGGKIQEIAEVEAAVSCPDRQRIELRFKSSTDTIHAVLKIRRQALGRPGVDTKYRVERFGAEVDSFSAMLPSPQLKSLDGDKPEEAPLKVKFSGFAYMEWERSTRFGYDVGTTSQTARANFNPAGLDPQENNFTFFTNFGVQLDKDSTSLVSLFEIGEIYYGDLTTGGKQGARK